VYDLTIASLKEHRVGYNRHDLVKTFAALPLVRLERAIDRMLGVYEQLQREFPRPDPRFRIEHWVYES
jgi:hypothetical protein